MQITSIKYVLATAIWSLETSLYWQTCQPVRILRKNTANLYRGL